MINKFLLSLILLLVIIVIGFYYFNQITHSKLKESQDSLLISSQNLIASNEVLTQTQDSIQSIALLVENLQKNNKNINSKYNLLSIQYKVIQDSINVVNVQVPVDTFNNVITIRLNGREGKVRYDGYTKYIKQTGIGTYSLKINYDPFLYVNTIYLDNNNNIRSDIYADGQIISDVIPKIDNKIFLLLQNNKFNNNIPKFIDKLKFNFELNNSSIFNNKLNANIGIDYYFNDLFMIGTKHIILNNKLETYIRFTPSLRDVTNLLF